MIEITSERLRAYLRDPVALIAEQLVLEDGRTYGEAWEPWQRDVFGAIFARNRKGIPKYRLVYSERRRGESKTEDLAAVSLADLLTGPSMAKSYACAADEDQAALILDSVRGFKARSPILADIDVGRSVVANPHTGSELIVLSSDAPSAYGLRPRRVIFDELSLQRDERLWLPMWSAIGKRADAQLVAVSMAGWDLDSIGWRIREAARTTRGYYFHSREGSTLAPWLSPAAMDEQRATLHPADFARLWECRWVEPKGSFVTAEMYDAAVNGTEAVIGDGMSTYSGFVDIGLVHDATAVAVVHRDGDRVILDSLHTLQGTRSMPVELAALEALVADLTRRFRVQRWVFESPQAVASVQRLQDILPATVEARYPTADTQARLWGTAYRLIANGKLVLFPHERLRREFLNLHLKTMGGRLKVVDSSAIHQDHALAVAGAADVALEDGWASMPAGFVAACLTGTPYPTSGDEIQPEWDERVGPDGRVRRVAWDQIPDPTVRAQVREQLQWEHRLARGNQ